MYPQSVMRLLFLMAILPGLLPQRAAAEVAILRGENTLPDQRQSLRVQLSRSVDTTRSLLLHSYSTDHRDPEDALITVKFIDGSTIEFARFGSNGTTTLHWQVLEFSSGVRVQRGTHSIERATTDIPIEPVNPEKAVAFAGMTSNGSVLGHNELATAEIRAPDILHIAMDGSPGSGIVELFWQVWEYSGCRVQPVSLFLGQRDTETSLAIDPVERGRSILVGNTRYDRSTIDLDGIPYCELSENGSELRLTRLRSESSVTTFSGYVVEFNDGSRVLHDQIELEQGVYSKWKPWTGEYARSALFVQGSNGRQGRVLQNVPDDENVGAWWAGFQFLDDQWGAIRERNESHLRVDAQIVTFARAPEIILQPQSRVEVTAGEDAVFQVQASGDTAVRYEWRDLAAGPISGATGPQLVLPAVGGKDDGRRFACLVTNGTDSVLSATAMLVVVPASDTSGPVDTTGTPPDIAGTSPDPTPEVRPVPGNTSLNPGTTWLLEQDTLVYPEADGASSVQYQGLPAESIIPSGFARSDTGFLLSAAGGVSASPLELRRHPDSRTRLYRMANGKIYSMGGDARLHLSPSGVYFLSTDVLAPEIRLVTQRFISGDSTLVTFLVSDNVHNLLLHLYRRDDSTRNIQNAPRFSGEWSFALKNPAGALRPLEIRLRVGDGLNESCFPPDCRSEYPLAQSLGKVLAPKAPAVGSGTSAWDILGIPFNLSPGPTLGTLQTGMGAARISAAAWDAGKEAYLPLESTERLKPGGAIWLAAPAPVGPLVLDAVQTEPFDSSGTSDLHLVRGWNQVSSPHLRTMYWPVSRLDPAYPLSPVKGLHAYNPISGHFSLTDSLEPWRGYFVYCHDDAAVVRLRQRPFQATPAKAGAQRHPARARLELIARHGPKSSAPLLLQLDPEAAVGVGLEDEFPVPGPAASLSLVALRERVRLAADRAPPDGRGVQRWQVLAEPPGPAAKANSPAPGPSLALEIGMHDIPRGYAAIAHSRARDIVLPLEPGGTIPLPRGLHDTLSLWMGPVGSLGGLLSRPMGPVRNSELTFGARQTPDGVLLQVEAPRRVDLLAMVVSPQGRLLLRRSYGLPPGSYRLRLPLAGGNAADLSKGRRFLRLLVDDGDKRRTVGLAVQPGASSALR